MGRERGERQVLNPAKIDIEGRLVRAKALLGTVTEDYYYKLSGHVLYEYFLLRDGSCGRLRMAVPLGGVKILQSGGATGGGSGFTIRPVNMNEAMNVATRIKRSFGIENAFRGRTEDNSVERGVLCLGTRDDIYISGFGERFDEWKGKLLAATVQKGIGAGSPMQHAKAKAAAKVGVVGGGSGAFGSSLFLTGKESCGFINCHGMNGSAVESLAESLKKAVRDAISGKLGKA